MRAQLRHLVLYRGPAERDAAGARRAARAPQVRPRPFGLRFGPGHLRGQSRNAPPGLMANIESEHGPAPKETPFPRKCPRSRGAAPQPPSGAPCGGPCRWPAPRARAKRRASRATRWVNGAGGAASAPFRPPRAFPRPPPGAFSASGPPEAVFRPKSSSSFPATAPSLLSKSAWPSPARGRLHTQPLQDGPHVRLQRRGLQGGRRTRWLKLYAHAPQMTPLRHQPPPFPGAIPR